MQNAFYIICLLMATVLCTCLLTIIRRRRTPSFSYGRKSSNICNGLEDIETRPLITKELKELING